MQDRLPLHPGRVRMTPVSGQANVYDMTLEDGATIQGTALNKANLLSDETANDIAAISDGTPPDTVNEALDRLVDIGSVVLENVYTDFSPFQRSDAPKLSLARENLAKGSVGNYALFSGGYYYPGSMVFSAAVDAYDASLTRTTPEDLLLGRRGHAGASVGNYVLFGGGARSQTGGANTNYTRTDAYDTLLVHTTPPDLSVARRSIAGASVGGYALFAGGRTDTTATGFVVSSVVDAYDAALTLTNATQLPTARDVSGCATVGGYAIFIGGQISSSSVSYSVDVYDTSLTRTSPISLSTQRTSSGASTGNYALFAGGSTSTSVANVTDVVDAFDASLTRTTPTALSVARVPSGTGIGYSALFAGDAYARNGTAAVDAYDESLTRTTPLELRNSGHASVIGASAGDYALFVAQTYIELYSVVDAFSTGTTYYLDITVPQWSKYYIDGVTSEPVITLSDTTVSAIASSPFNGYIRRGFALHGDISSIT